MMWLTLYATWQYMIVCVRWYCQASLDRDDTNAAASQGIQLVTWGLTFSLFSDSILEYRGCDCETESSAWHTCQLIDLFMQFRCDLIILRK